MRIRKRQVPFPLSAVTFSDPHLVNRSPVVVQLNDAVTTSSKASCTHGSVTEPITLLDRPRPSDQLIPPFGKPSDGCDVSSDEVGAPGRQQKKQECSVEDGSGQEGGGGQKGNDTRKGGILGSEGVPSEVFSPSSPSKPGNKDQCVVGMMHESITRWCDGEKAIPLKKRRGGCDNATESSNKESNNNKKKMKMRMRMKTKMNKKSSVQDNDSIVEEDEDVEEEVTESKPAMNVVGKKRVRGSALMEGSRCSRVNGRGWRCCQQTLVGYSLCEHHLGKGRLRSMTSVRCRSIATTTTTLEKLHEVPLCGASSSFPEKQTHVTDPLGNDGEDNEDEKKALMITKKSMKLGMVKARSISSLLGQTNTEIAENNK